MSNKEIPTPIKCEACGEMFYGRKGAKCCSPKCRKRKQYNKRVNKDINENPV